MVAPSHGMLARISEADHGTSWTRIADERSTAIVAQKSIMAQVSAAFGLFHHTASPITMYDTATSSRPVCSRVSMGRSVNSCGTGTSGTSMAPPSRFWIR